MSTWAVQVAQGDEPWQEIHNGQRFSRAIRIYLDETNPRKRLLRNGRCLRLTTEPDELDLLHREDAS